MNINKLMKLLPASIKTIRNSNFNQLYNPRGPNRIQCILFSTEVSPPKQIYYGILTPQVKAVKFFSLSSSMLGIVCQPIFYNAIVNSGNIPVIVGAYTFIGFFTFVTPFLLHTITKNYVTHLHYKEDTDTYIAHTMNFFCRDHKTEFNMNEVKVPDVPGMFTTLVAKEKKLFLDPRLFESPDHYRRMMGYDKPMDFKLYETPPPSNDKKD